MSREKHKDDFRVKYGGVFKHKQEVSISNLNKILLSYASYQIILQIFKIFDVAHTALLIFISQLFFFFFFGYLEPLILSDEFYVLVSFPKVLLGNLIGIVLNFLIIWK